MAENPILNPMTSNDHLLDALIRHQIFLMGGAAYTRKVMNDVLNKSEFQLRQLIVSTIGKSTRVSESTIRRIQNTIRNIRAETWQEVRQLTRQHYKQLIEDEDSFIALAVATVAPVLLTLKKPAPGAAQHLISNSVFEGRTLNGWGKDLERADIDRITTNVRIGIAQGESGEQVARRVVGTKRLKGRDGITQITRRNVEAVSITATTFFSNAAREQFAEVNSTIIKRELYVAVLDSKTTAICRSLDGMIFLVGLGKMPPLHFGCRSIRVPVLDGEALSTRPTNIATTQQLMREFNEANGLSAKSRSALPKGFKEQFDAFSKKRVKELVGKVPATTTYAEFLKRQSVAFQNDTLGVTKAKLFRNGDLTLDKFVNQSGKELTLEQISLRDPQAFRKAGLNPDNFN